MNILKLLSISFLTVISMSLGAMANFDLINSYPKVPVYYKINNEPAWHELRQGHVSRNVPAEDSIFLTLSATQDDSHPTYFVFSPQPAGITVPQHLRPLTCYIQVNISTPSNDIRIVAQNTIPGGSKTKIGQSNITFDLIRQFKNLAIVQDTRRRAAAQTVVAPIATATAAPTAYITTAPQVATAPNHNRTVRETAIDDAVSALARIIVPTQAHIEPVATTIVQQADHSNAPTQTVVPSVAADTPAPTVQTPAAPEITAASTQNTTAQDVVTHDVHTLETTIAPQVHTEEPVAVTTTIVPQSNHSDAPAQTVVPGEAPQANEPVQQTETAAPVAQPKGQVVSIETLLSTAEAPIIDRFFEILNELWTNLGKNSHEETNLIENLMPENQEQFMACVNQIRGSEENADTLQEDLAINMFWQHVLKKSSQADHAKILRAIFSSEDGFFNGADTLLTLLERCEQRLANDKDVELIKTWNAFQPALKLYYIKLLWFIEVNATTTIIQQSNHSDTPAQTDAPAASSSSHVQVIQQTPTISVAPAKEAEHAPVVEAKKPEASSSSTTIIQTTPRAPAPSAAVLEINDPIQEVKANRPETPASPQSPDIEQTPIKPDILEIVVEKTPSIETKQPMVSSSTQPPVVQQKSVQPELKEIVVLPTQEKTQGDAPQANTPVQQPESSSPVVEHNAHVDSIEELESIPEARIINRFFEIFNGLWAKVETFSIEQNNLFVNLMPENQEQFMACVNRIRGAEESADTLQEDHIINIFWQHVLKTSAQADHENFLEQIALATANGENIEVIATWNAFRPALKLYYLKLISFLKQEDKR